MCANDVFVIAHIEDAKKEEKISFSDLFDYNLHNVFPTFFFPIDIPDAHII